MTKRQELGAAIAEMREALGMSRHNLADKTRATTANVERWERGDLCPTTHEWRRMRDVFPKLTAPRYRELHGHAALEQAAEEGGADEGLVRAVPDLDAAVALVLEALPTLAYMTIGVGEDGQVEVSYRTREVRIVEETGAMTLARRKR